MCSSSRPALVGGARIEHRLDDRHVSGAAAEISRQHFTHAIGVAIRLFAEQGMCRRDHAGCAEPALQGMMLAKARLQGRETFILREPLDGDNFAALRLHCQQQTAAHGLAVEEHRAGTANPMLAADMRAGQPQLMAQAIGERQARLDRKLDLTTIDLEANLHGVCSAAILRGRSTWVPASALRYPPLAWMSLSGSMAVVVAASALAIVATSMTAPLSTASTLGSRSGRSATPITPTWALLALPLVSMS